YTCPADGAPAPALPAPRCRPPSSFPDLPGPPSSWQAPAPADRQAARACAATPAACPNCRKDRLCHPCVRKSRSRESREILPRQEHGGTDVLKTFLRRPSAAMGLQHPGQKCKSKGQTVIL